MDPVPRTCTNISPDDQKARGQDRISRPLSDFRSEPAYVLLGDPGAGKSTAFQAECDELGEEAVLVSARNFLTLDISHRPEWRGRTIFIDGLDEIRAGKADARSPLDDIRGKLDRLGRPPMRISCREADWLGANDQKHLEDVSPNSQVMVLRLDPLTEADIDHILGVNSNINDAYDFKEQARSRNLEGLLLNPQNLGLLTEVVAKEGVWPESRLETFEKACRYSARDSNREHRISERQSSPTLDQILDSAGRLCAIQLISGTAGYSFDLDGADDYPCPGTWDDESPAFWHQALSTKLFQADTDCNGPFTPIHRHIAEFLAARHLAKLIRDGLPASRVVSLIIGEDGAVVSEFRGLSAWLAAHCQDVRNDLIDRDPIGVGLYGDIRKFTAEEKHQLLKSLNCEVDYISSHAEAFAALASPETEARLHDHLTDTCRDRDHQIVIDFLLGIIQYGTPLPNLWPIILDIVRDDSWWPRVTHSALLAFIDNSGSSERAQDNDNQLLKLLENINNGTISDPDGELLGTLLGVLYPEHITPSEIWNYLTEIVPTPLLGENWLFWKIHLLEKSKNHDIIELLDQLYLRLPDIRSILDSKNLMGLPTDLLARILPTQGTALSTKRLYNWLSIRGLDIREDSSALEGSDESDVAVRTWLEAYPEIQKDLFLEGLFRHLTKTYPDPFIHVISQHLYDSCMPPDFGLWALDRAIQLSDRHPKVSENLLRHAVYSYHNRVYDEGMSHSVLIERVHGHKALENLLPTLLDPPREQWISNVRSNIEELQENRAHPKLLYFIAIRYFGLLQTVRLAKRKMSGVQRIRELFNGDEALVQTVISSLCDTVWREDIPSVEDIILEYHSKSQISWLAYPYLAGICELHRIGFIQLEKLDQQQKRIALALYHYYHPVNIYDDDMEWHSALTASSPEIVADVFIQCVKSDLHHRRKSINGPYNLMHNQNYAGVARYACLPLLRAFPVRCSLNQIEDLDYLLWSALQHADKQPFQQLVEKKLSSSSMNVTQRTHWIAAGLILSPETYYHQLEVWVGSNDRRIRHLAKFLTPTYEVSALTGRLTLPSLKLIVKLVGTSFGPYTSGRGMVELEFKASDLVAHLIQRLSSLSESDAPNALEELSSDPALRRWQDTIDRAQDSQRVVHRDAAYRHLNVDGILQTLSDEAPAGPADLAALVADRLKEMAVRIPASNTNDWRQYWNEDSNGQPEKPKSENSCRDALLSDLRERLPEGVDAQPEGRYAHEGRADIRVAYQDFNLPVEVKKNSHPGLWSAPRHQLAARYASDPATGGYGIYLVFWFGKERTQPSPDGPRPTTPEELRERLQNTLTPEEARKITVCVIDVGKPDRSKRRSGRQRLLVG